MTATVLATTAIGASVVYTSVAANDSVTLLQGLTFMNTSANAINILHANTTVLNMGTVLSATSIGLLVNSVADCDITNTASGIIGTLAGSSSLSGVTMQGDRNTLRNAGEIYSANGTGVFFGGTGSIIDNSGTITGGNYGVIATNGNYAILNSGTIESGGESASVAVYLNGTGPGKTLVNSGLIRSMAVDSSVAVQVVGHNLTTIVNSGTILSVGGLALDASLATGGVHLTNSGTMTGSVGLTHAVAATNLADTIINNGTINRSVALGAGDDLFDGIGGHVGGTVFGGNGNDVYRVSDALALVFELAAEGIADRVEATVSFSLAGTGEVEHLTLLGSATDGTGNEHGNTLTGNDMDNRLGGGLGHDTVSGLLGDDTLRGDAGNDQVLGGDGDDLLRAGAGADAAYGGAGDDALWGDIGGDQLFGDAGEDMLVGGAGRDTLDGGADADTFVFRAASDSGVGALRDSILGFVTSLDLVSLTRIDANLLATGNQAFAFIGTAAFGLVAGQLRAVHGANSVLQADVNGDGVADFEIQFTGVATISVNDILL